MLMWFTVAAIACHDGWHVCRRASSRSQILKGKRAPGSHEMFICIRKAAPITRCAASISIHGER